MKKLKLEELGRLSVAEFKAAKKIPVCILLDNVRSLHNVGSAFRTADAFSVEKLVLTGITGTPPHREIEKTALGATSAVAWSYHEDAAQAAAALKAEGWKIVVVEQTTESIPLQTFVAQPAEKICLVFGNEINGVSDGVIGLADVGLEIPQSGTKHSLNISVCVGIVVWEIYRKI
jgi:tRNA G18 (ribose-2'-O)-methylase SpoU